MIPNGFDLSAYTNGTMAFFNQTVHTVSTALSGHGSTLHNMVSEVAKPVLENKTLNNFAATAVAVGQTCVGPTFTGVGVYLVVDGSMKLRNAQGTKEVAIQRGNYSLVLPASSSEK